MIKRNKRLVMIGAGGHAKVCYDIAQLMNKWDKIVILDGNPINDYFEISGSISEFGNYIDDSDFFVAIGDNEIREELTNELLDNQATIVTLIHPQAIVAENVKIEKGSVIMAGVVINSATEIGKGCIINTSSSVDHDNAIGDFVHISPGAHLAGAVTIGKMCWIGSGVTIINNVYINCKNVIGAGAVVIKKIKEQGVYVGIPAKKLEE